MDARRPASRSKAKIFLGGRGELGRITGHLRAHRSDRQEHVHSGHRKEGTVSSWRDLTLGLQISHRPPAGQLSVGLQHQQVPMEFSGPPGPTSKDGTGTVSPRPGLTAALTPGS